MPTLTKLSLVTHICVCEMDQWFGNGRSSQCSVPSHQLNQCWLIVNCTLNFSKIGINKWNFCSSHRKFISICRLQIVVQIFYFKASMCYFSQVRHIKLPSSHPHLHSDMSRGADCLRLLRNQGMWPAGKQGNQELQPSMYVMIIPTSIPKSLCRHRSDIDY